uniref:Substrate-binding domain-containing protein n=1 Tax=Prevotella sp. GTC17260 TaxID=3236796 RepID=A0AB33J943_9BACT
MKKRVSYIFVGLTLLSVSLLASCGQKKHKGGRTDTYSSGVISFASDESFSPIIEEERQIFETIYNQAKVKPIYTNESDGINMLLKNKVYLVITARDYKKSELKNLRDRTFMPKALKIAYDGLALIVNKSNLDTCITVKDIARILTGKVTQWNQIHPGSKNGQITLVFDNRKSSAVHFAEDSILGGKPIASPNVFATQKTADVISYVEKTPGAIGIIGSNWLNDSRDTTNLTFNKNIRLMSVSRKDKATPMNSWKPYQYYIYNGNYPLIRTVYALLNDPINGLPWGFAHFLASPKGQMIILKSGLLPVQGNITIRDVNVSE